ncbi:unnamed protein product [Boreogadus saida]
MESQRDDAGGHDTGQGRGLCLSSVIDVRAFLGVGSAAHSRQSPSVTELVESSRPSLWGGSSCGLIPSGTLGFSQINLLLSHLSVSPPASREPGLGLTWLGNLSRV